MVHPKVKEFVIDKINEIQEEIISLGDFLDTDSHNLEKDLKEAIESLARFRDGF